MHTLTRVAIIGALMVFALPLVPAFAQMFRWTDEQGGIHYTQGVDNVPERFRANCSGDDENPEKEKGVRNLRGVRGEGRPRGRSQRS